MHSNEDILTPQETTILQLVAQNYKDREIAEKLSLAKRTINWHMENIRSKLNASTRLQAVLIAKEKGYI